jgi:hypothetical protein
MSAKQGYDDMLSRTIQTVSKPPPSTSRSGYSLAKTYRDRNRMSRSPFGQTATVGDTRGGGPLTQSVAAAKTAAEQPGGGPLTQSVAAAQTAAEQPGGSLYGIDEGDPKVHETAQLGELGGIGLHNAGQAFRYNPTSQNWEQPPAQVQSPAAQPLGPTLAPRKVSVGPTGPQISPMQLAPGQLEYPPPPQQVVPGNPALGLMNPKSGLSNPNAGPPVTQPGPTNLPPQAPITTGQGNVEVERGIPGETGTTSQTTTFGPGGQVNSGSAQPEAQSDFLKNLGSRLKKPEDANTLTQFADQGATAEQLMTQEHELENEENTADREAATGYRTALKTFTENYPGAQPNEQGQILNGDGSVNTDATTAYKDVADAKAAMGPVSQPADQASRVDTTQPNGGSQNSPTGQAKAVSLQLARQFLMQAGGDPDKARQLAKAAGYSF